MYIYTFDDNYIYVMCRSVTMKIFMTYISVNSRFKSSSKITLVKFL